MAVEIHAGDFRYKVVFKEPTSSLNEEGGREQSHTTAIVTWAKIAKFNQYRATEQATVLIGSLDFYVRYSQEKAAITKEWLIEYEGKDYTIHEIERISQGKQYLRFTAKVRE